MRSSADSSVAILDAVDTSAWCFLPSSAARSLRRARIWVATPVLSSGLPSLCPSSEARVWYARYSRSRRERSLAYCITGMYDGMSSVTTHGPFSAVASASPRARAVWAARPRADSGRPSTSSGLVRRTEKALVASSTLLEKLVDSCASVCWISLKRSLLAPVRATPDSSASRISASTMRCCASDRVDQSCEERIALKARNMA
mmetsp:Transcript_28175/g.58812  ORF Transcript_28175/g.58812 Transcript_28175/m.58812 type:complete len:202 (+) Transcript_28175:476-1081(+)